MTEALLGVLREAAVLALIVAAPPLLAAVAVGVALAIAQAAFDLEEPSLRVAPRIVASGVALVLAGPYIWAQLARFMGAVLAALPAAGRP